MKNEDKNRYNHFNSTFLRMSLIIMILFVGIAVASAVPVTFSNIEVTSIRDTSVVIQWDTDIAATGQIEYGLDTNYGSLTEIESISYWHPIEVTGLTEGTTYHYRIRANDYKDAETISGDYTFTTRTTVKLENVIRTARNDGGLPKTYYVKPDGSNSNDGLSLETAWATPYYASYGSGIIDVGDIIYVVDGSYSGSVRFVENDGIPEAPITMKAYNGTPDISGIIDIRADYITFDGFVCRNSGRHGIDLRGNTGIKILNCDVHNSGIDSIYLRDSTYVILENCAVYDSGWNGFGIKPTSSLPCTGHHHILRNCEAYDTTYHNAFDVHSDYMTVENCYSDRSQLAPYRIYGNYNVFNNCSGYNGNNGIDITWSLYDSIILNCTFDSMIKNTGGVTNNVIIYNNYLAPKWNQFAIYLWSSADILLEENEIYCDGTRGYTYEFDGGTATLRNEKNSPATVKSTNGAVITVEYTDGRTFSVNDAGEYTTYTWSSGSRYIEIIGWSARDISGTVADTDTGLGIEGAIVSDGTRSDTTNEMGNYAITNVPAGIYSVTCNASPIYQGATQSNVAVNEGETTQINFTLTKETTSPTNTLHSPTGTDVGIDTTIFVTFSEALNKTSAEGAFSISPSVVGSFNWDGNKMIFAPDSELDHLTTYIVHIGTTVEDLAGNNLASLYSWQFTTKEQDLTPPAISNVAVSIITGSSAIITWTTDEPSTSQIEYGLTSSYGSSTTLNANSVTEHSQAMTGLNPNTTYHYRVKSKDADNNEAVSGAYNFTTMEATGFVANWKFNEGSGEIAADSSGNGNNGTISGASWTDGKLGTALHFDGIDDYISIPDSPSLNPVNEITIETWVRPGSLPHAGWNKIVAKPYISFSSPWQQYALTLHDNQFIFELNAGGTKEGVTGAEILTPNTWYHVAGTYDGSEMRIYINGELSGTLSKSGAIAVYPTDVHIGAGIYSDAQTEYVNGIIDEVRILDRALSAEEIKSDYESSLGDPPTAATGPDRTTNPGASITFDGSASFDDIGITSYVWDFDDSDGLQQDATGVEVTHNYDTTGIYTATLTVTDTNGSIDSDTTIITVNEETEDLPPTAAAGPNRTTNLGASTTFDGSASFDDIGITSYVWDFNDSDGLQQDATGVEATHTYDTAGIYTATLTVTDTNDSTHLDTTTITVSEVNRAPVLNPIGNRSVYEDSLLQFTINATDPDGDSLSHSTGILPGGATFDPITRTFSWTPADGQAGLYTVHFEVTDSSLIDAEDITITVTAETEDLPPTASAGPDCTTNPGASITFDGSASTDDNGITSYVWDFDDSGGLQQDATGVEATHTYDTAGIYTATLTVTDTNGSTDSDTTIITVNEVNRAPVLNPIGNRSVYEDSPLQFIINATDPDGDSLSYSTGILPGGATFDPATCTFSWTPADGQAGLYTVHFEVTDGSLIDAEDITITVTAETEDLPPTASAGPDCTANPGASITFDGSASTDDIGITSYAWDFDDSNGLQQDATGVEVTHTYETTGTYTITLTVTDTGGNTNSDTAIITVSTSIPTPVNKDPVLPDYWNYYEGSGSGDWGRTTDEAHTGNYSAFLQGTEYYQENLLNIGLVVGDSNGYSGLNAYNATPDTTYNVSFWIKGDFNNINIQAMIWKMEDGSGDRSLISTSIGQVIPTDIWTQYHGTFTTPSDAKKLTLMFKVYGDSSQINLGTIYVDDVEIYASTNIVQNSGAENSPANNAPVLTPIGPRSTTTGSPLQLTISATDPDSDPLTYSATGLPTGATFNSTTRTFSWTPGETQAGSYQVQFEVTDSSLIDAEDITITVTEETEDHPPTASAGPDRTTNPGASITFNGSASTDDIGITSYVWDFDDSDGLQQDATSVEVSHTYDTAGTYTVTLTVTDTNGSTDSDTTIITVSTSIPTYINKDPVLPEYWNYYEGAGSGDWGRTTDEAHTGNYSAFLQGTEYYQENLLNIGLVVGDSNGYSGLNAYNATPDTTYNVSFWIKGNFNSISVNALTWNTDYSSSGRSWISTSIGQVTPTNSWTQYQGTFTTPPDAQKFVLMFKAYGDSSQINLGAIFVDDVEVTGSPNLILNSGAENSLTNNAPVLSPIAPRSTTPSSPLQFTISATDPDSDPLTYSATGLPTGATFNSTTRTFSWTPDEAQASSYHVHFEVTDDSLIDAEDITITVTEEAVYPLQKSG